MADHIVDVDVSQEMESSFLEYAYSVIYSRALPDARDGLKPVQRRIIYQMGDMGLRPDRPHVKSSRIVGDVMGKLHPHSDVAIYDALVRLSQGFVMRVPLVDGHGNFGTLDDGPAAPRYTEARLDDAALTMIAGLDEDVVDFVPNYDNSLTQPEVLPSAFPNLLVNGASGIAVGMATNMAPHNPGEVIAAARHLIENPQATVSELMRYVPGPDLPTGGRIIGLDSIREAYETGRGTFRTRATVKFENITARRKGIVVTELPYLVGPEKVIEKVKDQVQAKRLTGIASIDDYSDRKHGLRLVIGIKNGFNPEAVLEELYRLTPMEDSFGINNVCLVEGQPRTLGLKPLLEVFVDHRISVTRRRTIFQLGKAKDRLHLVEGLLIAILDIDEVVQLIRSSDDASQARTRLMDVFDLSEIQATYILDLQLRRLTKFSRIELEAERDELKSRIEYLQDILDHDEKLRALVSDELQETSDRIDSPRRTVLVEGNLKDLRAAKKGTKLTVADEPCWVLFSTSQRLARTTGQEPLSAQGRRASHDALVSQIATTSRSTIAAVTNTGRVVGVDVVSLPQLPPQAARPTVAGGVRVSEYFTLEKGEKIMGLIDPERECVVGTKQGVIKRINGNDQFKDGATLINLKPKDEIVGLAQPADLNTHSAVFITSNAQLLTFNLDTVRAQGYAASGVAGIRVANDAHVIGFYAVDSHQPNQVVTIATGVNFDGKPTQSIKVTDFNEFPHKGRGTGGVRAHRFLKDETELILGFAGPSPQASAATGGARQLPAELSKRDASGQPLDSKIDAVGTVPVADASQETTEPPDPSQEPAATSASNTGMATGGPNLGEDPTAHIGREREDDDGSLF